MQKFFGDGKGGSREAEEKFVRFDFYNGMGKETLEEERLHRGGSCTL